MIKVSETGAYYLIEAKYSFIVASGRSYEFKTNLDGIALSPADKAFDTVYYCALSSRNLYSVSTKTLQRAGSSGYEHNLLDTDVKLVGTKSSQSEGLAMDSQGLLFYGVLSSNAVSYWNSSSSYLNSSNTALLVQNDIELQWPDTFSFDDNGYLYASTNRLPRFISNSYDFSDINFRVVRVFVGTKSYQHSATEAVVNIGLVDKENALQIPDVVQLNGTAAGSQYDHSGDKANTKPSIPTGDTVSGQAENNVVPIITIASTILVAFMMA
jgi:sugar lactone lactonase YvrE